MIPEPQKTYLLELLAALGPAADEFVLVGGQALKFVLAGARATRDFDFLLDAISLREKPANVAEKLAVLQYKVVPESRNFQFQKSIPCVFHVGTDYGHARFPAHITAESLPTSRRFRCPHPLESTAHIDRNPHQTPRGLKARPIGPYMLRKNSLTRNQFLTR